jgi:hypothetical protein
MFVLGVHLQEIPAMPVRVPLTPQHAEKIP